MTKQVARLEGIIIHPLAFAVFPILSLYAKNMGEGLFREATGIAIGILVFVALLWLLADLFVKNKEKWVYADLWGKNWTGDQLELEYATN